MSLGLFNFFFDFKILQLDISCPNFNSGSGIACSVKNMKIVGLLFAFGIVFFLTCFIQKHTESLVDRVEPRIATSKREIQDFPEGVPTPEGKIVFAQNCMKLNKIGPEGAHPSHPLDPPLSLSLYLSFATNTWNHLYILQKVIFSSTTHGFNFSCLVLFYLRLSDFITWLFSLNFKQRESLRNIKSARLYWWPLFTLTYFLVEWRQPLNLLLTLL